MPCSADLTDKQAAVLAFISQCVCDRGYGPTVREIGKHFGIRSPNGVMCHLDALEKKGCIRRDRKCARGIVLEDPRERVANLQLAGVVRAGRPVLSEELTDRIDFADLFAPGHYALTVEGDSMSGDGICSGDVVIVRKAESADDGQLVIASVDGEQTIKRLAIVSGGVLLVPSNDDYAPIEGEDVEIVGVAVGLIRRW